MKGKFVWLLACSLVVAALLISSCAPAAIQAPTPTPEPTPTPTPTPTSKAAPTTPVTTSEMVTNSVGKLVEKPRYGGSATLALPGTGNTALIGVPDQVITMPGQNPFMGLTHDAMQQGDWSKSAQGTGTMSFTIPGMYFTNDTVIGAVASSWESPDSQTLVWHIRHGIHYFNPGNEAGKLVNGREMTGEDVAYSIYRNWSTPSSYLYGNTPYPQYVDSVTAADKWTVVVKMKQPGTISRAFLLLTDLSYTYPPEIIQKYGTMTDWHNVIGTGPFMLVDFVSQSSATYVRNPNYWQKDPLFPTNQLPYLDEFKQVLIADISTQLAGMRTHKIDVIRDLMPDDARQLKQSNPELKWRSYSFGNMWAIWLRNDKAPFNDVRVRNALDMGVDKVAIQNKYWGGDADFLLYPLAPIPEFADYTWKLEDLPQNVRELYEYHPDKAKQLLADAGFPNGFSMDVIAPVTDVDLLSIFKSDWAKIGVTLNIDVKEAAIHRSMSLAHTNKDATSITSNQVVAPLRFPSLDPTNQMNYAVINDAKVNDLMKRVNAMWPDEKGMLKEYSKMIPYLLGQSFMIQSPYAKWFAFWQPWIKSYSGESSIGSCHRSNVFTYLWVDRDLKESMTGRR